MKSLSKLNKGVFENGIGLGGPSGVSSGSFAGFGGGNGGDQQIGGIYLPYSSVLPAAGVAGWLCLAGFFGVARTVFPFSRFFGLNRRFLGGGAGICLPGGCL